MSSHQSYRSLLRFTAPSMGMMVLTSAYGIVDGFFVSNYAGKTAFAALNLVWPIVLILGTIGFMLGIGGNAVVSRTRGEGDEQKARSYFSLIVYATIVLGVLFAVAGLASLRPILVLMGIEGQLLELGAAYGTILFAALPALILQYALQSLSTTAGRPDFGFAVTVAAGLTNVALDALFVAVFGWGLAGAAAATAASMAVGGLVPLIYFARENRSFLRLGRPSGEWAVLGKAAFNGLSEMMTNIAMSVVAISYNLQLLTYLGEDGVAAYGVIVYISMVFSAVAVGYSMGVAPLMGYQYGARNLTEMQSLFRKSAVITLASNIAMFVLAVVLAAPLAGLFVGYDREVADLTVHATRIYSLAFLFMGFSVYTSSLFTSLGNGLVSALVSFFRTLLCEVGFVFLLPAVVGADGIWFATPMAEVCSLALCAVFVASLGRHYGYLPERGKKGEPGPRGGIAGRADGSARE